MLPFLARRFAALLGVLFCVVTITFFLMKAVPGSAFDREKEPPPHIKEQMLKKYGLDGSPLSQYARYLGDLVRGDLRVSWKYRNRSVNELLADGLPYSFKLGALSFVLAAGAGVAIGALAAARKNSAVDFGAMFSALFFISVPTFVTGPLLILIFGIWLGWLPVGGWLEWKSVILPAVCLAAPYAAYVARLMRNSMLDVLSQEFIRTAHAKGLSEIAVVYKHALKVAILPVVSFLGPLAAHLLTGSVVVEMIFSIPGAGRFFVASIENRDVFLLGGVVIVYCTILVAFNLVVDIAYAVLDKRIRLHG
ncbi:MAG: ABC transporter permease [Verrucomicrobiales bacterium]